MIVELEDLEHKIVVHALENYQANRREQAALNRDKNMSKKWAKVLETIEQVLVKIRN